MRLKDKWNKIFQVLQSHLEAVNGAPGEPQVFIEADPDGHGAYRWAKSHMLCNIRFDIVSLYTRFVVMTEEEAGTVIEAAESVEV